MCDRAACVSTRCFFSVYVLDISQHMHKARSRTTRNKQTKEKQQQQKKRRRRRSEQKTNMQVFNVRSSQLIKPLWRSTTTSQNTFLLLHLLNVYTVLRAATNTITRTLSE